MTEVMSTRGVTVGFSAQGHIPEGTYTETIYRLFVDGKYQEVVSLLSVELQNFPRSRAALSLLGYSYYMLQDFPSAIRMYEQLTKICPQVTEYKIYLAQCLYKNGQYPEATRASYQIEDPQFAMRVALLQASIKYEQEDLRGCLALVDQCAPDDPDTVVQHGCVAFKEGDFEKAREFFSEAMNTTGYQADLAYNIALCYYKLEQHSAALKHLGEIIERGVREHPELGVGSRADGVDGRSVGNSQVLKDTALVEAFNLRAAIEYSMKRSGHIAAAQEALQEMPPREEDELDPVTLHNEAIMNVESDINGGFRKLNFLIKNPPFPPQTFGNLLLQYCQHEHFDIAADVLAENAHLTFNSLTPELYDFLDATITVQASPAEGYHKFDNLAKKHIDGLRKLTKKLQDARLGRDNDATKAALRELDQKVDEYIPVLMSMAKIYWDKEHYSMVEKILKQNYEFCVDHQVWQLNVAHVLYVQGKYQESIHSYEPIVQRAEMILDVKAIVLANLCVAFIMTSQNEKAEELMKRIEKEVSRYEQVTGVTKAYLTLNPKEERLAVEEPDRQCFHLCIVNLVIGTLYCAKGNFEFGISRIMKSLEPYERKLGTDTWYYAKRGKC